jgi:hypothetical protein
MEKLMRLTATLPNSSKAQLKLSHTMVKTLWGVDGIGLEHPPMSYVGDQFKYRQPDGSNNVRNRGALIPRRVLPNLILELRDTSARGRRKPLCENLPGH